MHICTSKLPEETSRAWEDSLYNHKELPTWQQLSDFLSKRIETLETFTNLRKPSNRDNNTSKSQAFYSQNDSIKNNFSCKKCKQNHPLKFCRYFKSLSVNDRIKFIYANKYCANCFSTNHFKSKCPSVRNCCLCNQRHHSMLHIDDHDKANKDPNPKPIQPFRQDNERPSVSTKQNKSNSQNTQTTFASNENLEFIQSHFSQHKGTTILPTALVNVEHLGEIFTIRALLDAGSESSFITKRLQQNLALPLEVHNSQVSGLGGTVVGSSKGRCVVVVKSRQSNFVIKIKAIVVPKLAHFLPSRPIRIHNIEQIKTLSLADPYFFKPAAVDMIIGSDYLPFVNLDGVLSNIGNCRKLENLILAGVCQDQSL